jgi:hypothetical protein
LTRYHISPEYDFCSRLCSDTATANTSADGELIQVKLLKQILILCFILLISIVLGGCNAQEKKFEDLKEQAKEHYYSKDLVSASEVYSKALEIKEDPRVRQRYKEINDEIDEVKSINLIRENLKSYINELETVSYMNDLAAITQSIDLTLQEIKNHDISRDFDIQDYIYNMRESTEFSSLSISLIGVELKGLADDFSLYDYSQDLIKKIKALINVTGYSSEYASIQ